MSAPAAAYRDDWRAEALAVFMKDVRSELRTRAALATILLFAVVVLITVSLTVQTEAPAYTREWLPIDEIRRVLAADPTASETALTRAIAGTTLTRAQLLSGLLWIILFFSAMAGLPRTFVKEEEMRTGPVLRLTARPSAVLVGKMLFNAGLMLTVSAVVLFFFLILFRPFIANWPLFLVLIPLGVLGMAGASTIVAAMVARAGNKSYLMTPLAFPILLPILGFAINGTTDAIAGKPGNTILMLVSYVVAMIVASGLLFEAVWND